MARKKRTDDDVASEPTKVEPWTRPAGVSAAAVPGTVVRSHGKFLEVRLRDEPRSLLSTVRGSLKRERARRELIAVGDRVWVVDVGEDEGQIDAVEPRQRVLARLARKSHDVEQVMLANPDQALFLFSIRHPEPHLRMLDRFLLLAESRNLPAAIGVNKIDLDDGEVGEAKRLAETTFGSYARWYPVIYLSVRRSEGLNDLRALLAGKVTVVAGPSGAGKTSLLNTLDPDERRLVGEISSATGKGRHTTVGTRLYDLGGGTLVADTPGIRSLMLQGVELDQLPALFPEFRPFLDTCGYANCTHLGEPDCAITAAIEHGDVSVSRYESYASLRRGTVEE